MKKLMMLAIGVLFLSGAKAQELNVGVDIFNRYVWRGTEYGSSPSIQPTIEFTKGIFTIGAWGAYATGNTHGAGYFAEADLYASFAFKNGLSIGITDYYYPGTSWFEFDKEISSHAFELNLGYEVGKFSLGANYIINDSRYGAGAEGGDLYFELGYSSGPFKAFVGGGDGWHTLNGNFQICNIGIGAQKEIKITDSFSIPLSGSVILNPNSEQLFLVVGISF